MAHHISEAGIMTQVVVLELKARVREQERQLREQEKEIERLANSRYSGIQAILIAFAAIVIGAGLTLGILAAAGWWSP